MEILFFYLLGSLSYGCAMAYGPILLSGEGGSIGLFYFLFWLFFVISQFLIRKIHQHIHSEHINLLICFILMFFWISGLVVCQHSSPVCFMLSIIRLFFWFRYDISAKNDCKKDRRSPSNKCIFPF